MSKINRTRGIAPAIIAIIIAILAIGGGVGINQANKNAKIKKEKEKVEQQEKLATSTPQTLKIFLDEQNGSGQTGEAELISLGTITKVIVNLTGKPTGVSQPSHIHLGACATIGAVKYPLSNIEKGAAQTILPITLEQLITETPLALNVHKSATEISVYTSCGDISTSTKNLKTEKDVNRTASENSGQNAGDENKVVFCTQDARQCPDGTFVGRVGPNCEFKTCAGEQSETRNVSYNNSGFAPESIKIKKGETVKFTNQSDNLMWVASDPHPTHAILKEFDQKNTATKGESYEFRFEKSGTWRYHNHRNAGHTGTVIVE